MSEVCPEHVKVDWSFNLIQMPVFAARKFLPEARLLPAP